jgi:predicted MFS family arabinose efflux permease
MNIKQAIIKTNDALVYILLALVLITAILVAIGGQPIYGTVVLIVGWIIVAMLSGLWICISSIADNTQRSIVLTEQQNTLLLKLYKEIEANNVNNQ